MILLITSLVIVHIFMIGQDDPKSYVVSREAFFSLITFHDVILNGNLSLLSILLGAECLIFSTFVSLTILFLRIFDRSVLTFLHSISNEAKKATALASFTGFTFVLQILTWNELCETKRSSSQLPSLLLLVLVAVPFSVSSCTILSSVLEGSPVISFNLLHVLCHTIGSSLYVMGIVPENDRDLGGLSGIIVEMSGAMCLVAHVSDVFQRFALSRIPGLSEQNRIIKM